MAQAQHDSHTVRNAGAGARARNISSLSYTSSAAAAAAAADDYQNGEEDPDKAKARDALIAVGFDSHSAATRVGIHGIEVVWYSLDRLNRPRKNAIADPIAWLTALMNGEGTREQAAHWYAKKTQTEHERRESARRVCAERERRQTEQREADARRQREEAREAAEALAVFKHLDAMDPAARERWVYTAIEKAHGQNANAHAAAHNCLKQTPADCVSVVASDYRGAGPGGVPACFQPRMDTGRRIMAFAAIRRDSLCLTNAVREYARSLGIVSQTTSYGVA